MSLINWSIVKKKKWRESQELRNSIEKVDIFRIWYLLARYDENQSKAMPETS